MDRGGTVPGADAIQRLCGSARPGDPGRSPTRVVDSQRRGRVPAADCLFERRQPSARPRRRAPPRDGSAHRRWRRAVATGAAALHRKPAAGDGRCGHRPGRGIRRAANVDCPRSNEPAAVGTGCARWHRGGLRPDPWRLHHTAVRPAAGAAHAAAEPRGCAARGQPAGHRRRRTSAPALRAGGRRGRTRRHPDRRRRVDAAQPLGAGPHRPGLQSRSASSRCVSRCRPRATTLRRRW